MIWWILFPVLPHDLPSSLFLYPLPLLKPVHYFLESLLEYQKNPNSDLTFCSVLMRDAEDPMVHGAVSEVASRWGVAS